MSDDMTEASGSEDLVELSGELTIYQAKDVATGLLERVAAGKDIALDLQGVTELDTAGVQVLLVARREAQAAGRELRIRRASPVVTDVLQTLNLGVLMVDPAEGRP